MSIRYLSYLIDLKSMVFFIVTSTIFVCISICICAILTASNHRNDTYMKQCQKYVQ